MTRQLDAEAPAELLHCGLAHRIRDGPRPVDIRKHRTHHDDLPRLPITDSIVADTVLTTPSTLTANLSHLIGV